MLATALLLLLAVEPVPPTWFPEGTNAEMAVKFDSWMRLLPDDKRPRTEASANCFWAAYLEDMADFLLSLRGFSPEERALMSRRQGVIRKYLNDKCGGPGGGDAARGRQAISLAKEILDAPTLHRASTIPYLPPLPDRSGGDLGPQLWTMFVTLESRLASGGIRLAGDGRACAWASGALAAAASTMRANLGTPGIAAAVPTLQGQVGTHCRGQALAQKDAAWKWLREHRATQPLVVAARPDVPVWPPPTQGEVAAWLVTALLLYAPGAWPVIVTP